MLVVAPYMRKGVFVEGLRRLSMNSTNVLLDIDNCHNL